MNSRIRRKLDVGDRVLAFCQAHPTDDPTHAGLVTRLGDRLSRAHALATQERAGRLTERSSVDAKDEIKLLIHRDMHILSRIAELIEVDVPGVDVRFEVPAITTSHQAFLTAAQTVMADVGERREQFLSYGMPSTLLDELTALVGRYVEAIAEKHAGVGAHVGANAELEKVISEVMLHVNLLDRIYDVRFLKNAELLAAWKSAKELFGPIRPAEDEEGGPEQPGTPGTKPEEPQEPAA